MSARSLEDILRTHKVLICVGSGGVGKTTTSAALGVRAAQLGLKVLVMTIDPSRRLKVALGLSDNDQTNVRVQGQNYKGELFATLLNAEEIFKDFIVTASSDPHLGQRLLKNRLFKQLSTTLSGSQEFTSLLQLSKIVSGEQYDLVILDTPPAQHAVDFLEAPAKINALFHESIIRWFLGEDGGVGFVGKIIARGTRTVLSALEKITGGVFMRELNDFFACVTSVQHRILSSSTDVQRILNASSTGFILVTGFDEGKLREAEVLNEYLAAKGHHMVSAMINRAYPQWVGREHASPVATLDGVYGEWVAYHAERERIFTKFAERWRKKLPVVRIPDLNHDIQGLQGLEGVANEVDLAFSHLSAAQLQSF